MLSATSWRNASSRPARWWRVPVMSSNSPENPSTRRCSPCGTPARRDRARGAATADARETPFCIAATLSLVSVQQRVLPDVERDRRARVHNGSTGPRADLARPIAQPVVVPSGGYSSTLGPVLDELDAPVE